MKRGTRILLGIGIAIFVVLWYILVLIPNFHECKNGGGSTRYCALHTLVR